MSSFVLEGVFGSSNSCEMAYKQKTGEMFVGIGRIVKRVRIRSSSASILSLQTEEKIVSLSVDGDLLLALDSAGRVYLHSLVYDTEIGRMLVAGCLSAIVKDEKVFLGYRGYLQEWVVEPTGFCTFKKTKTVTGHRENITMMKSTEDGILTSSPDSLLRLYPMEGPKSVSLFKSKSAALSAKKIGREVVSVWENGEITRLVEIAGEWTVQVRKFTMLNLLSADISTFGDMAVVVDTSHNVLLFSTLSEKPEPTHKIFLSEDITQATFIEDDEWIVLAGQGSVVWEWKTGTLLANEQDSSTQRVAKEVSGQVITGTEKGEVFLWDRLSGSCIQKIKPHTSPVVEIIPLPRGFISVSSGGDAKVHKISGEVTKHLSTEVQITCADGDDELLAVAGPGRVEIYDTKRSKQILYAEIDLPLALRLKGTSVLMASISGLTLLTPDNVSSIEGQEPFVLADISATKHGVQVSCLGESGMVYTFTEDMEEVSDYRALPKYANGMGQTVPLDMKHLPDGSLVVTYTRTRPDRYTDARTTLYASLFYGGYEVDRWIVLERSQKETGKVFTATSAFGVSIGVCTFSGALLFSDRSKGFKPTALWQKETPQELEALIKKGDALSGLVGAVKLQNVRIAQLALNQGDALVLGKYFPEHLASSLFPLLLALIGEGVVEKPLSLLKELLVRVPAPPMLRRQLSLLLGPVFSLSVETTGSIDALLTFPHLSKS
ncbi:hypothetical protein NEDG_01204 [Nematocida displodere]|uniref:Uncharacterized protein n=1 Tax=Nematocida displodere TaxID=1805483 RepID=A0A177EAV9_9MICR|nr:hypothetical protein NEDG_01204 [Nematocida displodere]